MKRRVTFSIALVLSIVLVSLMRSDSTANASQPARYVADSGIVHLGPNESLRIMVTAVADGGRPTENISLVFHTITWEAGTCRDDGVCSHTIASQTTSDPVTLMPGEAVSMDILRTPTTSGAQARVVSDSPNVRVGGWILDSTTGDGETFIIFFSGPDGA